jgi:hypothetical protein
MHLIQHNRYQRDKENGNCLKCRCKTILIQPSQETWASSTNTLAEAISDLTEAIKYGCGSFYRQPFYRQSFYRQPILPTGHLTDSRFTDSHFTDSF